MLFWFEEDKFLKRDKLFINMVRFDITGVLIGTILAVGLFIIPLFINTPYSLILSIVVFVSIILIVFIALILTQKFFEMNRFVKVQNEINNKTKERFKIYERFCNIESKIDLL